MIQAKTLVDSSKPVWLTEQKFGRLNQNVFWNQPNTVNQTILSDEPFFFWVIVYRIKEWIHGTKQDRSGLVHVAS